MDNRIKLLAVAVALLQANVIVAQTMKITIPKFKDKYCDYVKKLESGHTDIDYTDFRNSFLDSKQFDEKTIKYDSLKKEVFKEISKKNYDGVIKVTQAMLCIDYTSMFAHKYLQQTYKIIGDTVNRNKYHDIEFGLLRSITGSGDGKTCGTGWHVTQIEEEYFILNMLDATLQKQSITNEGKNLCDKMVVKTEDGEIKTYFFEAIKVFEREKKSLGR